MIHGPRIHGSGMGWRRGALAPLGAFALHLLLAPAAPAQDATEQIAKHAEAAREAQRAGDFPTAIREFTSLARLLPKRADVQSNLGLAYFFNQQPTEALASFERALRLDPNLVSALLFSGIAHYNLSKPARATPLLERAVARAPEDPFARTWLAHSYAAQARLQAAVEQFEIAAKHAPQDVDVWYGLGHVYLRLGQQAVARLAEMAPAGARIAQLSGDIWLLRAEPDNALALYREALKRRPDLAEVQLVVTALLERQRRTPPGDLPALPARPAKAAAGEDAQYVAASDYRERAQEAFERIAALGSDSYRAHQVLAESLAAQERLDEAIAEYRLVLRAKPALADVHLAIGNLLMSEGRAAEALDEYQHELRVRPESAEVHYRMGRSFLVLGRTDEAEAAFTRALALGDAPAAVRRELGRLALTRGKPAEAITALSAYVDTTKNDAAAHYLLMQAYRAAGDAAAADRQFALYEQISARDKQDAALKGALSLFKREPQP